MIYMKTSRFDMLGFINLLLNDLIGQIYNHGTSILPGTCGSGSPYTKTGND